MDSTLFSFFGALSIDFSLNKTIYKSLLTLLPFILSESEYYPFLKEECVRIMEIN